MKLESVTFHGSPFLFEEDQLRELQEGTLVTVHNLTENCIFLLEFICS